MENGAGLVAPVSEVFVRNKKPEFFSGPEGDFKTRAKHQLQKKLPGRQGSSIQLLKL